MAHPYKMIEKKVYGDVMGEGVVENAIFEPTNPYSCSKGM